MLLNSYVPTGRRRILVGLFCALGFLSACDTREVTGPAPLTTASDAKTTESASSLGSVLLKPTVTSHPVEVANLPFQPVASIRARTWVVVRAHGSVTMTPIPDCGGAPETPNWVCGVGSGMPEFSSAAPTESGPVQVMANWSTGQARVPLRGGAGGGAVGLLRAGSGVTLTGRLNLPGNYWYRVGEDPVPTYTFSGGYTVSAEGIGTPLRVQEGPADDNGTREYSAMPLYGLQFVNPLEPYYLAYQPAGALTWKFIYGRNVADDGSGGIGLSYVTSCSGKTVCRYTPSQSGRMVAGAFVEGQYVEIASVFQRVVPPEMKLTCNAADSITRGDTFRCSVSAEPSGTLTEISWSFADLAGHTIPGPTGTEEWSGRMVVGGSMRVSAVLDGQPVSAEQPIAIRARNWPKISAVPVDGGHGDLPNFPTITKQLAHTHPPEQDGPIAVVTLDDGPNRGWSFVSAPIASVRLVVHISDGFKPGTQLYQKQHSGTDPVTGQAYCSKGQFTNGVQTAARRHEGITSGSTMSHVEVYKRWFKNEEPEKAMEAVVGWGADFNADYTFAEHAEDRFIEHVSDPALKDPNQSHTNETPPGLVPFPTVPCKPRLY